jgi:hypothetical protein
MGVDEYISMSEHSDQLRTIIDRMLARTRTAQPVRTVELVSQAPRPVRDPLPLAESWIASASTA